MISILKLVSINDNIPKGQFYQITFQHAILINIILKYIYYLAKMTDIWNLYEKP